MGDIEGLIEKVKSYFLVHSLFHVKMFVYICLHVLSHNSGDLLHAKVPDHLSENRYRCTLRNCALPHSCTSC